MMHLKPHDRLAIRPEIQRKLIHLTCSSLPLAYQFYLTREQILFISGMITLGLLAGELLRRYWQPGILLFEKIFSSLLREEEKNKLTGATHLFISATITIFLFEKSVAVPAILTVTISDSMAAIAGKSIGRHPIFNKTLEGSVTFFCMTTAIFYFEFGHLTLLLMLTAGMVTLLEVLPLRFNDNLSIALATAFLLMLGGR